MEAIKLNAITVGQLPAGFKRKPYYPAQRPFDCDLCNWNQALSKSREIWLCDDHARKLGKLW